MRYYLFSEWNANLRARPFVTVTVLVLAAAGLAGSAALQAGLSGACRWWEQRFTEPQVEVYLKPETSESSVLALTAQLQALPQVQAVTYVTAEQARQEAEAYLGALAFSVLPQNPLPASIRLVTKPEYRTSDDARRLSDALIGFPGVAEIVMADELLALYADGRRILGQYARLLSLTTILWTTGWLFCGIFLVLRVRSAQGKTWQYLGVSPAWLRWPPIAEGLTLGVCCAILGQLALLYVVRTLLPQAGPTLRNTEIVLYIAAPPVAGCLAGWLAYRIQRRLCAGR